MQCLFNGFESVKLAMADLPLKFEWRVGQQTYLVDDINSRSLSSKKKNRLRFLAKGENFGVLDNFSIFYFYF
jgi:hypothetical protein